MADALNAATARSLQEWTRLADYWIARSQAGEPNRVGLLDDWMWAALGEVTGLSVLDLGCGEGRFCRLLAARGAAQVVGVDLCPPLIEAAKAAQTTDRETYRVADMQQLDGFSGATFDRAVSYITLVDVPDLAAAVAAVYRVLRPGGRFIVANLAPMATATNERLCDPDGSGQAIRVDDYLDEGPRVIYFRPYALTNYHRTLSTYLNTFLAAGFRLDRLDEPYPSEAQLQHYPALASERRAPSFILYTLTKPA